MSGYTLMADILLLTHSICVMGIVFPIPVILIGRLLQWKVVTHFWFRTVHLVLVSILFLETVFDKPCPLTVWEQQLRLKSGTGTFDKPFMEYWVTRLLPIQPAAWVYTSLYIALGIFIFTLYFWIPPRRKVGINIAK
jgi:hypothetical protein